MGGRSSGSWSRLGNVRALEEKAKLALQPKKKNVFISFSSKDMNEVNLLRGQAKNENSDIEFNDHSVRSAYNSEVAEYIKRKITERINRTSTTVVYLTDNISKSQWVKWEVEKSHALGKKVIAVHKGDNFNGNIPSWLNASKIVSWSNLSNALD